MYQSKITKMFELVPESGTRKSYYGKAKYLEDESGRAYLASYDTIVAMVDGVNSENPVVYNTWRGYSKTTFRHIKTFLKMTVGKDYTIKEFRALPLIDVVDWLKEKHDE